MNEVVGALTSLASETTVLAVAVYPRTGDTGLLEEQGAVIEELGKQLQGAGAVVFRVMHSQIVVLFRDEVRDTLISNSCVAASTSTIEVRATSVLIDGPRKAEWLDELLGDLSLRRSFGTFAADAATRWIDGALHAEETS